MNLITQKLNSKRGASLIIALLFMLICMTVGAVVLTAATANAGRSARIQAQQKDYLAVQSAARLLRDDIQNLTVTAVKTTTVTTETIVTANSAGGYDTVVGTPTPSTTDPTITFTPNEPNSPEFAKLLGNSIKTAGEASPPIPLPLTRQFKLTLNNDTDFPAVELVLTVQDDYSILVKLKSENNISPPLTLTLASIVSNSVDVQSESVSTDDPGPPETATYITTETTTETTTIKYDTGVIQKGA